MDKLLLGIDIGTTGTKAAVFTEEGIMLALGHDEYEVSIPHSNWAEQDPETWWQAVCKTTRYVLEKIPQGPESVVGVAVSSQAPTLLPLNKNGEPVRPAMIWMDRRAEKESEILRTKMGEGIIEEITGNHPDPFYVASKLLWLKSHETGNFEQSSIFLQANGYINYKLTGQYSMDNAHASLLQLRDYSKDEWSEELCELCGVGPDQFPPVLQGHEVCGEVTKEASLVTGLLPGTPVMAGTVDSAAAALEAGITGQGTVAEMTGTSTVLIIPNEAGIIEPAFIAMPHALPGIHLLLGALATSGASLKWFRDELGSGETYDGLTKLAKESKPGSSGVIFLPYMMGERSPVWDTNARGVFFGLSLSTSRGDIIRSILEGTSFALRHNFEVANQAGINIGEIRSVGGGTKSPLWNQIKSDVLGIPVLIPEASIGAPFGDAVLAGMGLGLYDNIDESLKDMVKIKDRYEPDMENHQLYSEMFELYKSLYGNLRNEFDALADINK